MQIVSYFDQLKIAAAQAGVDLRDAFIAAGLNSSVFYRARAGMSMNLSVAERAMQGIHALRNPDQARS